MHRFAILLMACGAPQPEPPANAGAEVVTAPAGRCLPVVTSACGCVYSCGVGTQQGDHWVVKHAFWKDSELKAKVAQWCVDGRCTEAFDAEIVCDGICPRKPADPTCKFVDGTCRGRSE